MQGPKKIIVGTDLSDSSRTALETTAYYAKTFDADVVLVSVFDPTPFVAPSVIPGPTDLLESATREIERSIKDSLAQLRDELFADRPDRVELVALRHPAPGDALVDLAEERGADLIVVASHGRTGIKRVLLGSVAERITRLAKCAVLVVRTAAT
ncbi:MAG: universal stress protein [Myxococcales bacterium]|nr:universal stress protein [Myxococcales bacterium]